MYVIPHLIVANKKCVDYNLPILIIRFCNLNLRFELKTYTLFYYVIFK